MRTLATPLALVTQGTIANRDLVSNGGYGGVNLATRHGIPLVLSGVTEDKAEVNRRAGRPLP